MDLITYRKWLDHATRLAGDSEDGRDLLHDSLVAALYAQRVDLKKEANQRWFLGVIRNRLALARRSDIRRKRREDIASRVDHQRPATGGKIPELLLDRIPRSARTVALLILHGLGREEIAVALDISDASFRQRLRVLRKALDQWPREDREALADCLETDAPCDDALEYGRIRETLLSCLQNIEGIGSHDPDGHLLIFSRNSAHGKRSGGNRDKGRPQ